MTVTLEAGIVARDPAALCDFYTAVMKFALLDQRSFAAGEVYRLRRGDARVKIFHSTGALDPPATIDPWFRPGGWRYAALRLDRAEEIDEVVRAIDGHTAPGRVLVAPIEHGDGGRLALVCDPEGNTWELLADSSGSDNERR
jgi:predicted enzyme related to lactoylglutathione lyase